MMLKALSSTLDMSEWFYNFALYNKPMNYTSSTASMSSTKYIPGDLSTESNTESSRRDMKVPDIYSFVADIQWRLDPHWRFCIIHMVLQTKSILTSSSPLGLGTVKSRSRLVMPMPLPYNTRDSTMLGGKQTQCELSFIPHTDMLNNLSICWNPLLLLQNPNCRCLIAIKPPPWGGA